VTGSEDDWLAVVEREALSIDGVSDGSVSLVILSTSLLFPFFCLGLSWVGSTGFHWAPWSTMKSDLRRGRLVAGKFWSSGVQSNVSGQV